MAALAALRQQLSAHVNMMFAEGMLDKEFRQLQQLQENSPGFVVEVIGLYCENTEKKLKELTEMMDKEEVDYFNVDEHIHFINGGSLSVGARFISLACSHFQEFRRQNDKESLLMTLSVMKNQFSRLQSRFDTMLKLEKGIQAYEAKSTGKKKI